MKGSKSLTKSYKERKVLKQYHNMSETRFNILVDLAKGSKKILNLGDTNDSLLTKKLKKIAKVTTADLREGADLKLNIEKGIKTKERFDAIIAGEIFEHIYQLRRLLKNLKRILKPRGKLILSVPNVCNLKSRIKVLVGKLPTYCADADTFDRELGGHIRDFNESTIKRILTESGFKILKAKSGGLWFHDKLIIPASICKPSFGDNIIISASK